MSTVSTGLWCETFDADLLAVVPGVLDALGDTADVQVWTHSGTTNGRINCPSGWWSDWGLTSFFATTHRQPEPSAYYTTDPLVECTFLEAVRDEWVHGNVIVIDGRVVWRPNQRHMLDLMHDLRGVFPLSDEERERLRRWTRQSLERAAHRLALIVAPQA